MSGHDGAPRFIAFVSRSAECEALLARYPDVRFAFASHTAFAPDVVAFDPRDPSSLFEHFRAAHADAPFAGMLNRREKFVIPAVALAQRLGLRSIARDGALLRDKLLMRRALDGRSDAAFLVRSVDDASKVPASIFPAVLKPRFGFNSRAVVRARDATELARAFREHHAHYRALKRPDGAADDFIVERYLEGREHTVEALVIDGEIVLSIVSDKAPMHRSCFVETGDVMPSQAPRATQETVLAATRDAVRALGFDNGWAHVEVMEHRGSAAVVEVAARMGGGYHEELIDAVYELDRMRLLIDLHLGPLTLPPLVPRAVVVGRRVVTSGVTFVRPLRSIAALVERRGARLVFPSDDRQISRVVVGPPYGYK
ncbi:MAG: acetyl-CoA carboxylase biotin carboxylase subunit family protein, partial [Polyangiales bacterium]